MRPVETAVSDVTLVSYYRHQRLETDHPLAKTHRLYLQMYAGNSDKANGEMHKLALLGGGVLTGGGAEGDSASEFDTGGGVMNGGVME